MFGANNTGLGGGARDQEYAPLLFAVTPLDQATPRAATPLRADSSLSTQRRSGLGGVPQTPGSMATDATPPPPPPIMRLAEDVVMGEWHGLGGWAGRSVEARGFPAPDAAVRCVPCSHARAHVHGHTQLPHPCTTYFQLTIFMLTAEDPGSTARGATPPGRHTPQQPPLASTPPPPPPQQTLGTVALGFEQQQPAYEVRELHAVRHWAAVLQTVSALPVSDSLPCTAHTGLHLAQQLPASVKHGLVAALSPPDRTAHTATPLSSATREKHLPTAPSLHLDYAVLCAALAASATHRTTG